MPHTLTRTRTRTRARAHTHTHTTHTHTQHTLAQEERREMDQTARFEVGSTANTLVRLPVALNSDSIDSDTTHKKKRPKC